MGSANNASSIYPSPAELLQRLIQFDTTNPPGNESECIAYIDTLSKKIGLETTRLAKDPNRPNLITRLKGVGSAPPLLLYGHIDVVSTANQEWTHPPFEGKLVDGYIWGRGALDMKSGVVMMLSAVMRAKTENLIPAADIIVAILCDEEGGGDYGAKYVVEKHAEQFSNTRYALGEFGGFSQHIGRKRFYPIQIAEKQICSIKATVRGPGGHGALPMRGGTMAKLANLLRRLDKNRLPVHITPVARQMIEMMSSNVAFPKNLILRQLLNPVLCDTILKLLGTTGEYFDPLLHNTVNATIIRGGDKINVIPGEISVELDGRLLPGFSPDDMIKEIRQIIGDEVEIEITKCESGPSEPDMGLFGELAGILGDADPGAIPMPLLLSGCSDARIFSRLGIQTYGFTPMKLPPDFNFAKTIHAADERIPLDAVTFGTDAIYELLKRYKG
ncbi:MAG: M20/M25/M40 family metallo-hydrolase [Desulfobacterales bacterium]|jgi:acetylornithine deacetylase/succinyl-diaminopimelate desuccinylase-like protein